MEDDGDITALGELIAHLPIDIRLGKLVILGYLFDVLEECIIIAAGLCNKSIFSFPFEKKLKAYANKLVWSNQARNFQFSLLFLLNFFPSNFNPNKFFAIF